MSEHRELYSKGYLNNEINVTLTNDPLTWKGVPLIPWLERTQYYICSQFQTSQIQKIAQCPFTVLFEAGQLFSVIQL